MGRSRRDRLSAKAWRGVGGRGSRLAGGLIDAAHLLGHDVGSGRGQRQGPGDGGALAQCTRTSGWELTVANPFSYRWGWVDDPWGQVIGPTRGWGLGLGVGLHGGDFGGFRYDEATVPSTIGGHGSNTGGSLSSWTL